MTDSELDAIRTLLTAATPGPWFACPNDLIGGWCVRTTDAPPSQEAGEVADFVRAEDARFIAACSPPVIAALLAEVDRLRGELAEAAAASDRGVYPHTTTRRAGGTAFCRCGHVAQTDATTWGDDCPLALRAALATARDVALEEAALTCEGLGSDFAYLFPEQDRRTVSVVHAACNDAALNIRSLIAKKEAP